MTHHFLTERSTAIPVVLGRPALKAVPPSGQINVFITCVRGHLSQSFELAL
jgi:hypothetical protein